MRWSLEVEPLKTHEVGRGESLEMRLVLSQEVS